jgi:hypothetical protein
VEITVVSYKNAAGIGRHAVAHAAKGAPTGSTIFFFVSLTCGR